MSGLLTDEEAGKTDLGTLEKRLAEKSSTTGTQSGTPVQVKTPVNSNVHHTPSSENTPQNDSQSSPRTSVTSAGEEVAKDKREDVENLSDMMCSLVTNNCGETRYIGMV